MQARLRHILGCVSVCCCVRVGQALTGGTVDVLFNYCSKVSLITSVNIR